VITRVWLVAAALAAAVPRPAAAWGDQGHRIIALIAEPTLTPAARARVEALLAADTDTLTAPDIASAATWADKVRDINRDDAKARTGRWHFVDIEIDHPDLDAACFGHPVVPPEIPASEGPAQDCVIDKIAAFAAELANPATAQAERIVALKYVLHLVGDLHQPLHAADDHDRGGNDKRVSAPGVPAASLHHYWDDVFVHRLGDSATAIASELRAHITPAEVAAWSDGSLSDWAMDSFRIGRDDAYGGLRQPDARGSYTLTEAYMATATKDASWQLAKAGVRLAAVLNHALGAR
jgi:S1/P1 Nuclease